MGLFGGDKTVATTTKVYSEADNLAISGEGNIAAKDSTINILDEGAINSALANSRAAIDSIGKVSRSATEQINEAWSTSSGKGFAFDPKPYLFFGGLVLSIYLWRKK